MAQSSELPTRRHEKHWVSDGNVILSATSRKKEFTVLFRVHKSLLAEQSEIFASMFGMPQPEIEGEGTSELYEGLPMVRLPDSIDEVCGMLDALRDPYDLYARSVDSDTPLRIRGALHMASKYLMTKLRANLVRILESEWPLSVEDLETMDKAFLELLGEGPWMEVQDDTRIFAGWPSCLVPEPAAAIHLAEEYDIPSILPAAYYDLLRCNPRRDWDMMDWDDLVVEGPSDKPARWDCLSRESLLKMYRMQDALVEAAHQGLSQLRTVKSPNCRENPAEKCGKGWLDLLGTTRGIGEPLQVRVQDRDIFKLLRNLRARTSESDVLCFPCKRRFTTAIGETRDSVWESVKLASSDEFEALGWHFT